MQQGGFPRVNKNCKWSHIGKAINIFPQHRVRYFMIFKIVTHQEQESVKKFYLKWLRSFEGEGLTDSIKKQLIPPGMELPSKRKKTENPQLIDLCSDNSIGNDFNRLYSLKSMIPEMETKRQTR